MKQGSGETEGHRKVVEERLHRVLGVHRHIVAADLVEERRTVLAEERRIAPEEEHRIVLVERHIALAEEEPRKGAVDTVLQAGCIAAGDMDYEKEHHHRVAEAEGSLEVAGCAGPAGGSPVVDHIPEQAKNHNLAEAGLREEGIGHVVAVDNLLVDNQHWEEISSRSGDLRGAPP